MHWELLLKAPSVSGEQELPDTKLMYIMYLSAPNGVDVIKQIIETNKSNRGIRNIPKWNQQIINTHEDRLQRLFPNIDTKTSQKNAKELVTDMKQLTSRDVSYKNLESQLKDLIVAQDFEGIEKWLQIDSGAQGHAGKRKRAVLTNIDALKQMIINNPPDKYIHAYYYDISNFKSPSKDFSNTELGPKLKGWVRISNGNLVFVRKRNMVGKAPPFVIRALEGALGSKQSFPPSKLVKYIGGDVSPGMEITPVTNSEYILMVNSAEDVLNYLTLLGRLGITSNEFMLGDNPGVFYNTILKKQDTNTTIVYPALRTILKEGSFDVDDWYMSEKGTREERAVSHMRDKMLRQWKVTRTKSRTGEKTTEEDISDLKQQIREGELEVGAYEELRNLFTKSPTEIKRLLSKNKDGIKDLYDSFIEETGKTEQLSKSLFSEENYDFLVDLEQDIEGEIDTIEKLANHFGINLEASGQISIILEDILTNDIMGNAVKISELFTEPITVGKGMFKYTGRRINTSFKQKVQEEQIENPSEDLDDLLEHMDKLYKFLKEHKKTVNPTEKKTLIQALQGMKADEIEVSDFSPTNLVLEDVIEMMCQLNWIFGDKTLIRVRNSFIRSIKEKKANKEIPKFISSFNTEYPNIRTQLVDATKNKLNDMIKSGENIKHYDNIVRSRHKKADFYNRLVEEGLVERE